MKKLAVIILLVLLSTTNAYAENKWYYGKITKIITKGSDGGFEVFLDNEHIQNNCLYNRVWFDVSDMGVGRTKAAFMMALSAFALDKDWGVIVDLPITEARCFAAITTYGAGIRK